MTTPHVPPGRMGKLWLRSRLELAERAVSLLEEKLRLLGERRDELHRRAEDARRDWYSACREAEQLGTSRRAVGGPAGDPPCGAARAGRRSRSSGPPPPVCATPTAPTAPCPPRRQPNRDPHQCSDSAGQAGPTAPRSSPPPSAPPQSLRSPPSSGSSVPRELRARALNKHWLPRLHNDLARVEMELEEQDRAEAIRLRLVELGGGTSQQRKTFSNRLSE